MNLTAKIKQRRQEFMDRDVAHAAYNDKFARESRQQIKTAHDSFIVYSRQAMAQDYVRWLMGHLQKGGNITHYYDYDLPLRDWLYIGADLCVVTPLYGASSRNIIVGESAIVGQAPEGIGHNNIYYCEDFSLAGDFIPCYEDVARIIAREEGVRL